VVVATQGLAELERADRALPQQFVQNTAVRVPAPAESAEDALAWTRHLGEPGREELSRRFERADWFGGTQEAGPYPTHGRWDFHVRPEELQALGTGEAIVQVAPVVRRCRWLTSAWENAASKEASGKGSA
jgi:hypothetical protein